MEDKPAPPGYAALRVGRESRLGAEYFLTASLNRGLDSSPCRQVIMNQWQQLEEEGVWWVRTAVLMPDHIHLLIRLSAVGALSQSVRLFKGRLSSRLRASGLAWQSGFFDHQLRAGDDVTPVFLYIYLNPYRAGLCTSGELWPGYYCAPDDWTWFRELTRESLPQPEWLR